MADEIENATRRKITRAQGELAQRIARASASADLGGDPKFSGWKPELDTQLKTTAKGDTIMTPTRSSAGPWTVAEFGRHQGNAGGFAGPGINRRSGLTSRTKSGGLRKVRGVKGKRWNGVTAGKGTASKAGVRIDRDTQQIAEAEIRRTISRHFDVT